MRIVDTCKVKTKVATNLESLQLEYPTPSRRRKATVRSLIGLPNKPGERCTSSACTVQRPCLPGRSCAAHALQPTPECVSVPLQTLFRSASHQSTLLSPRRAEHRRSATPPTPFQPSGTFGRDLIVSLSTVIMHTSVAHVRAAGFGYVHKTRLGCDQTGQARRRSLDINHSFAPQGNE